MQEVFMVLKDNIANISKYTLADDIKNGLKYLRDTDFSALSDGRYEISDNMYVNIESYQTKLDGDYEAHKNYVDIQYVISGEEKIGVTDYFFCASKVPYDSERDIEFLTADLGSYIYLKENEFMILYPQDAHKPCISINAEPVSVRKSVVKVKVK